MATGTKPRAAGYRSSATNLMAREVLPTEVTVAASVIPGGGARILAVGVTTRRPVLAVHSGPLNFVRNAGESDISGNHAVVNHGQFEAIRRTQGIDLPTGSSQK